MSRLTLKLQGAIQPKPDSKAWVDIMFLVVFGTWFWAFPLALLPGNPTPDADACHGPGFVDFGCTGGTEAVIANVVALLFGAFLFSVFLVALLRLVNRLKKID